MSFIDHIKYGSMRDNPDSYFNNVKVVNFDIINHECHGDKLIGPYKGYKTIKSEHLTNNPKNDAEVVLSAAFQNRDDLWVKHDFMIKLFREYFNWLFFVIFIREKMIKKEPFPLIMSIYRLNKIFVKKFNTE